MDSVFGQGENRTSSWEPEPTRRGSFTILSTCLVTLSLCVLTAIHLNIPERGKASQIWRKFWWTVLAIFAPELIVFTAYQQFRDSRKILQLVGESRIRRLSPTWWEKAWTSCRTYITRNRGGRADLEDDSVRDKSHFLPPWTMVHGHYFAMGGLAMEIPYFREVERYTVDIETFQMLLSDFPDAIPNISKEEIMDKSKANGLAKSLVCFQASWFCIQCVHRICQGLSISLLELSTFGHSICALLMYLLWWYKPLNIEEPTIIRDERALGYMAAKVAKRKEEEASSRIRKMKYDGIRVSFTSDAPQTGFKAPVEIDGWVESQPESDPVRLYMGQSLYGIQYERKMFRKSWSDRNIRHTKVSNGIINAFSRPYIILSEDDRKDWKLAGAAHRRGIDSPSDYASMSNLPPPRIKNRPGISISLSDPLGVFKDPPFLIGVTIAGFTYGGLHTIAWNAPFRTALEQLFWRVTALYILAFGPAVFALLIIADGVKAINKAVVRYVTRLRIIMESLYHSLQGIIERSFNRFVEAIDTFMCIKSLLDVMLAIWQAFVVRDDFIGAIQALVFIVLQAIIYVFFLVFIFFERWSYKLAIFLMIGLYALSRIYLVVECFLQIGHLPESVFSVPTWSQYVPHIS